MMYILFILLPMSQDITFILLQQVPIACNRDLPLRYSFRCRQLYARGLTISQNMKHLLKSPLLLVPQHSVSNLFCFHSFEIHSCHSIWFSFK